MAANRKKGKKPQNSTQGKSSNKKAPTTAAESVSDNVTAGEADPVSVDRMTEAAASSEAGPTQESQSRTGSTEGSIPQNTIETESVSLEGDSPALKTEAAAEEPDREAGAELSVDAQSTAGSESEVAATETAEEAASEPATPSAESSASQSDAEVGAGNAPSADAPVDVAPEVISSTPPASKGENADWPSFGQNAETVATEQSEVKLTTNSVEEAKAAPQKVSAPDGPTIDENFTKDEVRTLLIPVSPFHRLIACVIVIFSYSIVGYMVLKTPAGLNAQGRYTIDLPDAGSWVFLFRGDTQDAYGWTVGGRFRESLEVDLEPVEPRQIVKPVTDFKDLSGVGFFTVAEFEVNQPGKYTLWIKWNDPNNKCQGKIQYEKDPVETFFFKLALGIVGTIALFYMVGIPLTTRKAQVTLPNSSPPVVTK